MEITLYYFKIPFWRAEVARLALFISDIAFKDYRFESKDTEVLKKDGKLPNGLIAPFKQLPVLDVDGKIFAQTGAIARFCGKLSGLYPKNNEFEAAQIDQIIEAAQDINYLVTLSGRDKEKDRLALARKILATKHLPKFIFFEKFKNTEFEMPKFVSDEFGIWLIGYDGSIKDYSKDDKIFLRLFNLIDSMPMRQNEIKKDKC